MKRLFKSGYFFLYLMLLSSSVYAAQSSFQISPPPIATPEFDAGKVDKKFSATYVGISGTGFDLSGAGVNSITRTANSDMTALDLSFGGFIMSGTMASGTSKGDLLVMNVPFSVNLEFQPVKNENMALILFGGPMVSLGLSSFKYQYQYQAITSYSPLTYGTKTDTMTSSTTTLLYGAQGGAQLGIKAGDFTISPFAMFQSQQGTSSTTTSSSSSGSGSSSISIPAFTSTSYGMDILYRPWNMTLSSMLQEAAKSGSGSNSNEGFKTTIISLSWNY